jgi:hypothetical protein
MILVSELTSSMMCSLVVTFTSACTVNLQNRLKSFFLGGGGVSISL